MHMLVTQVPWLLDMSIYGGPTNRGDEVPMLMFDIGK